MPITTPTMKKQPTPETDAEEWTSCDGQGDICGMAVDSDFARKLERERDDALLMWTILQDQLAGLREHVRLTIMENLHLADGDNCTLKRLKDAVGFDLDSAEHDESINAREYPVTRQLCSLCEQPTGRCEEDSIFADYDEDHELGPICEECRDSFRENETP